MKKYVFKPYSKRFPELFENEKQRIISGIKEKIDIEHIGSTAVPNLGGKGIIDIAIAVSKENIESISKQLQKLGYEFKPHAGTPDRLFFLTDLPDDEAEVRKYHIHLTYLNSKDWKEMISFRDYLRGNPKEARKYAESKKKAAQESNEDKDKYMKLKEPAIKDILDKLLKEHKFS